MDQFSYGFGLINLLREAPGNPVIWDKFLAQLTNQLNCDVSSLSINSLINRDKTHFLFHFNINSKQLEPYEGHYTRLDLFNFFIGKNPRQVFCNQDSAFEAFNAMTEEKHVIANKFPYCIGFSIPCNHHFLSLNISRNRPFSVHELQRYTRVLQAIINPLEEAIHDEQQQKIYSQLIHQCHLPFDGYLIIDQHLNIVLRDPVYNIMFTTLDCLDIYKNQLSINDNALKYALLAQIITPREQFEAPHVCTNCRIGLLPVKALDNLYSWECFKDDFILTFSSTKYQDSTLTRLMTIHQLSKSEGLCALHFINTPSIAGIADEINRSQDTVRNHIKRIMQKMRVHNQAALMKKLITLASL